MQRYQYTIYGLRVVSAIPLFRDGTTAAPVPTADSALESVAASAADSDVVVELASLAKLQADSARYPQQVVGRLAGIGRFDIEEGRRIRVDPEAGVDAARLAPSILGTAMAVILLQRGRLVLHASGVAIQDRAVAFVGAAGWGKSTLAAACHARGHGLLTDDVLPISLEASPPEVIPAFPQIKLWEKAAVSLGQDPEHLPRLFAGSPKLAYTFNAGFQATPLPLERIYFLGRGDRHAILPISPQEAFMELLRHTRANELLVNNHLRGAHLLQCSQLLQHISCRRFLRQPDLGALNDLVAMVEADLAAANPPAIACP